MSNGNNNCAARKTKHRGSTRTPLPSDRIQYNSTNMHQGNSNNSPCLYSSVSALETVPNFPDSLLFHSPMTFCQPECEDRATRVAQAPPRPQNAKVNTFIRLTKPQPFCIPGGRWLLSLRQPKRIRSLHT